MSLADARAAETATSRPRRRIDDIWDALAAEDQAELLDMLDSDMTSAAITRVLKRAGHQISENGIREPRRDGWRPA